MPALSDLDQRIQCDPDPAWLSLYESHLAKAQEVAKAVPLVHTAGEPVPFKDLLIQYGYIPTTADEPSKYYSDLTRRAEESLQLGACAYFYAGRSCSEFGDVVLAFDEDRELPNSGSATPFDTGGMFLGYIHSTLQPGDLTVQQSFVAESISQWQHWREALAQYLAAYFHPISSYWKDRPCRADPEEIFTNEANSWRAWTIEVRFKKGQPILDTVAWTIRKAARDELFLALLDVDKPLTLPQHKILRFRERCLSLQDSDDPYQAMQHWIEEKLGDL